MPESWARRIGYLRLLGIAALVMMASSESRAVETNKIEVRGELQLSSRCYTLTLECHHLGGEAETPLAGHSTASAPCVLTTFSLTLDDRRVPIPVAAFQDLANPSFLGGLGILETRDDFAIHLEGGDGENSYEVKFLFVGGRLVRRTMMTRDEEGRPHVQTLDFP